MTGWDLLMRSKICGKLRPWPDLRYSLDICWLIRACFLLGLLFKPEDGGWILLLNVGWPSKNYKDLRERMKNFLLRYFFATTKTNRENLGYLVSRQRFKRNTFRIKSEMLPLESNCAVYFPQCTLYSMKVLSTECILWELNSAHGINMNRFKALLM
jgi:hypothetical protein